MRVLAPQDRLTVRGLMRGVETVLPTLATPITLTSGAANTFGAWTTIGTPDTDAIMQAISIAMTTIGTSTTRCVIELRYGSATTFEEIPCDVPLQASTGPAGALGYGRRLAPFLVPVSSLIEARLWSVTATMTAQMCLMYFKPGDFPAIKLAWPERLYRAGGHLTRGLWTPTLSGNGTAVASGTTWVYGSWTQMIASANAGLITGLIVQYIASTIGVGRAFQVEIGIGSAGNEITVYRTGICYGQSIVDIDPPVEIPQGSRISLRVASSSNSVANSWYVKTQDFK